VATGNRKAYEDSEEAHWWLDPIEEDRNSKEPKTKTQNRSGWRRRHNNNEGVDVVILGG
jgi:hypothetical protein